MAGILDDKKLREVVDAYTFVYRATNPDNETKKSYREFTSQDIAKLDTQILKSLRIIMLEEKYEITDALLPDAMTRGEFLRSLLRELTRRGVAADPALHSLTTDNYTQFSSKDPAIKGKKVTVDRRAFGVKDAKLERVTESADIMVIHDATVDIMQNNPAGLRLFDDVAKQVGIQGGRLNPLDNDAEAYAFGYVAGSLPHFKNNNGIRISPVLQPTQVQLAQINEAVEKLTASLTNEQVQALRPAIQAEISKISDQFNQTNYCRSVDLLFDTGRAQENNLAVTAGFAQARIDSRSNFDNRNDRIGLFGDCPNRRIVQR